MIVSHKHRFIFIAVPKTGTHSIRALLQPFLGPDDIEQVALHTHPPKYAPWPGAKEQGHGHFSAQEIKQHLGEKTWHRYFKFAFVRNPLERFVSTYFFMRRHQQEVQRPTEKQWLQFLASANQKLLLRPQHQFIDEELDFIGRIESFTMSVQTIFDHLNLGSISVNQQLNQSQHQCADQYLTSKLKKRIYTYYEEDYKQFDYPNYRLSE